MIPFPKKTWEELDNLSIGVFDGETNGFLKAVTKLHCIVSIDPRNRSVYRFKPYTLQACLNYLHTLHVIVGHNIIGFDLPVMKKLYGWEPLPHQIILDTLWMSRMYNPDLEGGHSINAWGERLGNKKIEYYPIHDNQQPHYAPDANPKDNPGWDTSVYTENMGIYCEQDVVVNVDLFNKLLDLLQNFSWRSIICEMETAVIIQRQMEAGFCFNYQEADMLHAKLMERQQELEDIVHTTFLPLPKLIREVQPRVKMDGTVSSVGLKKLGDTWSDYVCPPEYTGTGNDKVYTSGCFSTIEFPEFSLGSRQQIAERLVRGGYKLTKFTDKGNAIIDDSTLEDAVKAGIAEARPLAEYFMVTKRVGMLKDWLARAEWHEDQGVYRIHGFVNSMGTVTHRMSHNSPNVAQVPANYSPYGEECRALFTVRPGYTLVGCDADGLELRCLAHYTKDASYIKAIVEGKKEEGTDVHSLTLNLIELLETRDQAKKLIYTYNYGGGDLKVGEIVGGGAKQGKTLKAALLKANPGLKGLKDTLKKITDKRSWLKGIDGRIIRVRAAFAALNTLLQNMGAVIMKYWLIEVARKADEEGLDWNPCANIHDEGQFEVVNKDVPRFNAICEEAFDHVSQLLDLNCPVAGSADNGNNWSLTH